MSEVRAGGEGESESDGEGRGKGESGDEGEGESEGGGERENEGEAAAWFAAKQVPGWLRTHLRHSRTSSGEPRMTGMRWCTFCGTKSMMRVLPVVARPPACSTR